MPGGDAQAGGAARSRRLVCIACDSWRWAAAGSPPDRAVAHIFGSPSSPLPAEGEIPSAGTSSDQLRSRWDDDAAFPPQSRRPMPDDSGCYDVEAPHDRPTTQMNA